MKKHDKNAVLWKGVGMADKDRVIEILKGFAYAMEDPYGASKSADEMDYKWYAKRIDEIYKPPCNCSRCTGVPSIEDYYKDEEYEDE